MTLMGGELSAGTCSSDTLCKTNSTGPDPCLNSGIHDARYSKQADSCSASLMLPVFYGGRLFIKMFIFLAT
jgi:hypothetical protein